jgi:predicted transcriptional regulator
MPKILISIMPEFVRKIFAGVKKIELRKRKPKFLCPRDRALVYASSPIQAIFGEIEITDIVEGTPREIWEKYSTISSVPEEFFESYYQGHSAAAGLLIGKTFEYQAKITLEEIRQARPGFSPPQNYFYLTEGDPLLALARKSSESLKSAPLGK